MKRHVSVLLGLIMVFVCLLPASATGITYLNESVPRSAEAPIFDRSFLADAQVNISNGMIVVERIFAYENDQFMSESVCLIPAENITIEELMQDINEAARGPGNKYETELDASLGVMGWIRIYYDRKSDNGIPAIKLTSVEGGYVVNDKQLSVTGQEVLYGIIGTYDSGVIFDSVTKYPSTNSWQYYPPSNWPYIYDGAPSVMGANCKFTVKRAGSTHTWDFYVNNYILGTV